METTKANFINPGENNLNRLARKWRVSPGQLHEAILQTGSLEETKVYSYLTRDSWIHHPATGLKTIIRNTVNFIF